jgi:hypothetical protein
MNCLLNDRLMETVSIQSQTFDTISDCFDTIFYAFVTTRVAFAALITRRFAWFKFGIPSKVDGSFGEDLPRSSRVLEQRQKFRTPALFQVPLLLSLCVYSRPDRSVGWSQGRIFVKPSASE